MYCLLIKNREYNPKSKRWTTMLKKQKKIIDLMIQYIKDGSVESKTKALKKPKKKLNGMIKLMDILFLQPRMWLSSNMHESNYIVKL